MVNAGEGTRTMPGPEYSMGLLLSEKHVKEWEDTAAGPQSRFLSSVC